MSTIGYPAPVYEKNAPKAFMKTLHQMTSVLVLVYILVLTLDSKAQESNRIETVSTSATEKRSISVTGRIRSINGKVHYSKDGEKWDVLKEDTIVTKGDWIRTLPDSSAYITLAPYKVAVKVNEDTILRLTTMKSNPQSYNIRYENDTCAICVHDDDLHT